MILSKSTLVVDVECTTKNKGNPFTRSNRLVNVGLKIPNEQSQIIYVGDNNWKETIQQTIDNARLLVGFNIKFDLHWLRRYGITFDHCRVFDCQLAEFLISYQRNVYPSLNDCCTRYGIDLKLDVVKTEYWEKGIDTDQVPKEILSEYLDGDLDRTERVAINQERQLALEGFTTLHSLQCQDLLILQDMEYNGSLYNVEESNHRAEVELYKTKELEKFLSTGYEDIPIDWNSRDHVSCYLYGGEITYEQRIQVGLYKTGQKEGQPRFKILKHVFKLPQQVAPLKGSELKKEGYYATDDTTLRSIKTNAGVRKRIHSILERSKSTKLYGTYYRGLPELIEKMDWPPGVIHGSFNQCVAATGRLSSSNPNLQNFAGEVKQLLTSRY